MKEIIDFSPTFDAFENLGGPDERPLRGPLMFPMPGELPTAPERQIDPRQAVLDSIRRMSQDGSDRRDYEDVTTEGDVRPISW